MTPDCLTRRQTSKSGIFELSNRAAPLSLSSTRWCLVLGHVCWVVRCGLGFVPLVLFASRLSPFAFRLMLRACRNHGRDIGYWPYSIFLMFMFMFVRWIEGRNNCPCISHLSQITFPRASPAPASPPLACLLACQSPAACVPSKGVCAAGLGGRRRRWLGYGGHRNDSAPASTPNRRC